MIQRAAHPLVSVEELSDGLASCLVVDCRFELSDPEAGHRAYLEAHIPGAVYAHLDDDLSSPRTATSGRHPLPEPEALANFLACCGWSPGTPLVAYDAHNGAMAAARLWWLMRWAGQEGARVLDGGFAAWQAAGLAVEGNEPDVAPARPARIEPRERLVVDADAVQAGLEEDAIRLVDARGAARFRGDEEPLDPQAGHVPGAVNLPFTGNVDEDGRFLPAEDLRERFEAVIEGRRSRDVVHMCGSGVTAAHNILAMEVAGLAGSKLYPGSWSEWSQDESRPVATGDG